MKEQQLPQIQPSNGDSLLIGKYITGFNRKGQPVFTSYPKGKEPQSKVDALYEDGTIRSAEGDVFAVRLLKSPTTFKTKEGVRHLPAQWITIG